MSLILRRQDRLPALSNIFDRFFDSDLFDWSTQNFSKTDTTLPAVNIKEDNEKFVVEMAAPGMKKEDFKVELKNKQLKISSETRDEVSEKSKDETYSRKEFSYQSFIRTFNLPDIADSDKIEAKYDSGILKLNIHKKEEAKPKPGRFIDIN